MRFPARPVLLPFVLAVLAAPASVQAQADAAAIGGDLPIETYLSLLSRIAPAARDGAEAYLAAFRERCGRAMQTVELRRAFAERDGDPTLMAMVRASHEKDTAAVQRLGATIACPRG